MGRFDLQIGGSDHMFASVWHQRAPAKFASTLPQPISNETYSDPQNSWVSRFNYDEAFTRTLLNHMSMGYLNRNEGYGSVNQQFVDEFPQIAGVAGNNVPPHDDVQRRASRQFGNNAGVNVGNITTRPTFIINDMRDLDEEPAHAEGRHGVPQDHGQHPRQQQPGRDVQLRARRHGSDRREQRQPDRELPARRGRQRRTRRSAPSTRGIRGRTRGSSTPATRGG